MRFYATALFVFTALATTATQARVEVQPKEKGPAIGVGLFCETAQQVAQFIRTASDVNVEAALKETNLSRPTCAVAPLAYYEHEKVTTLRGGSRSFRVVRATVVAVEIDHAWMATVPGVFFIAFVEKGESV